MNEKLKRIKAALRLTLELDAKATPGPWTIIGQHKTEVLALDGTPESIVVVDTRFFDRQTNMREVEDAAFIAHARTYHPAAARALLTAIGALEEAEAQTKGYSYGGGMYALIATRKALETICREWPDKD